MIVKELIEALGAMNPSAKVQVECEQGSYVAHDITHIEVQKGRVVVETDRYNFVDLDPYQS